MKSKLIAVVLAATIAASAASGSASASTSSLHYCTATSQFFGIVFSSRLAWKIRLARDEFNQQSSWTARNGLHLPLGWAGVAFYRGTGSMSGVYAASIGPRGAKASVFSMTNRSVFHAYGFRLVKRL
jgi:hypothetical protein